MESTQKLGYSMLTSFLYIEMEMGPSWGPEQKFMEDIPTNFISYAQDTTPPSYFQKM